MQLTFDPEVEIFLAEFVDFLDQNAPAAAEALDRPRSSSHVPDWARRWQRLLFDNGWLVPGNPPEFGGRNATIFQQYVHQTELARRRMVSSFNSQGVGIIAASLVTFGTAEQQQKWAIPILRAEMTAALGMSEPGAGSDLASLRTRAERDGDDFVVNGQKVWTSGAHDADVILTFVRTDVDAPKHQGISVLLIPTDSAGLTRRPFASAADEDDLDFNEVFFTDVRVPAQNLVGRLNGGWSVASGSLGHERNMLWLSYADRLQDLIDDWQPSTDIEKDQFATLVMDNHALRLLGSAALARASHGDENVPALSMLKLLGAESVQMATEHALDSRAAEGLDHAGMTAPYVPLNLDAYAGSWADRYIRSFAGTIAGGTSEIQRNIIAQRVLGLPRR
ncbi:acyl-CoA dehydrogenase family protein [Mycolicibacterium hodleri]|uniref:Acyl-CoA dehydrogenase n=1 Tax=Mycolicibacterium hodleri TaxID=49897 RepID=A0A502E9E5_9MYCO|nr:acyl-CoA dehydrogenase family protein [Mycolicibacterium hodleri]TPG33136.1 acyl-CoA dehydrogenase [Mycolicibacterium hodleri]